MKYCGKCQIWLQDNYCPKCGSEGIDAPKDYFQKSVKKSSNKLGYFMVFVIFVFIFMGVIDSITSDRKATTQKKLDDTEWEANRTQTAKERESYTPPPPVRNSAWDGSVHQVKSFLKKNLKDPDSVQYIEWSDVVEVNGGGYAVRCKYRAKNSFGGYVINEQIFFMSSEGDVTSYTE